MSKGQRYRVNSADIVNEVIEGEVIAIDLARGTYYSLSESGAHVWALLAARPTTLDDAVALFNGEGDREEITRLFERLRDERLILPADGEEPAAAPAPDPVGYTAPVFEKYDDMQDYFLLDPIHEVGTEGWPPPAPEAAR